MPDETRPDSTEVATYTKHLHCLTIKILKLIPLIQQTKPSNSITKTIEEKRKKKNKK